MCFLIITFTLLQLNCKLAGDFLMATYSPRQPAALLYKLRAETTVFILQHFNDSPACKHHIYVWCQRKTSIMMQWLKPNVVSRLLSGVSSCSLALYHQGWSFTYQKLWHRNPIKNIFKLALKLFKADKQSQKWGSGKMSSEPIFYASCVIRTVMADFFGCKNTDVFRLKDTLIRSVSGQILCLACLMY